MLKFAAVLLLTLCLGCPSALATFSLPESSSQLVVGLTDGWNSSTVTLTLYERAGKGAWRPVGAPWQGRLGSNGCVWGLGIHPLPAGAKIKTEGDGRAPAGAFRLGGAWGYDAQIQRHPQLPYRQVTARDLWVEDTASPDYNRHLVLNHDPATPWEQKQQMRQGDYPHSLKLFIAHNAPPHVRPGAGSAIFFHIWRGGGGKPTAGCTTMAEASLRALIARLDPNRRPLYLLLPKAEYTRLRDAWKLP
jgi:L,D-peptidoglycan transpeptidase YkuD (ErfK/YbiS/YcfS/YnhG family)